MRAHDATMVAATMAMSMSRCCLGDIMWVSVVCAGPSAVAVRRRGVCYMLSAACRPVRDSGAGRLPQ